MNPLSPHSSLHSPQQRARARHASITDAVHVLGVALAMTLTGCASVDKRPVPDGSELVPINGRVLTSKPAKGSPPVEKQL
jgi:hypothetical protein